MDIVERLLNELGLVFHASEPWGHQRSWFLPSHRGAALRLLTDAGDEQVMLLSQPGALPDAQAPPPAPWRHTLDHPAIERVRCTLVVEPDAGVWLADVWPRHALHAARFGELLDDHARRHAQWQLRLVSPTMDRGTPGASLNAPWLNQPHLFGNLV